MSVLFSGSLNPRNATEKLDVLLTFSYSDAQLPGIHLSCYQSAGEFFCFTWIEIMSRRGEAWPVLDF
jgi:hypothetical protein